MIGFGLAEGADLRFELVASSGMRWFAAAVLVLAVLLGVRAWLRSQRRGSIAALEVLRVCLIAAVLFVLLQPERVVTQEPERRAKVAVLWDDSGSMGTRDVAGPGGGLTARGEIAASEVEALREGLDAEGIPGADVVFTPLSEGLRALEGDAGAARGTDLGTPLAELLAGGALRAVLLMSDGDWNEGASPYDVARSYRLEGVPIFTRAIGSRVRLPDIAVDPVEPPAFAVTGRPVDLAVSIDSAMPRDATTTITLTRDGEALEGPRTILVPARRKTPVKLRFRPDEPGRVTLTVSVDPVDGEIDQDNNARTFEIDVREERLRVLLIEGWPRWEYRYLRNALLRDPGVDVDCYLTHPGLEGTGGGPAYLDAFPPKSMLSGYDVIFVGDVGVGEKGLSAEECAEVAGLVRDQASGLILMPGMGGAQLELMQTELGALFPVDLDPARPEGVGSAVASPLVLTESGETSSLTRLVPGRSQNSELWVSLPGFQWNAAVSRARVGSRVLAVHGSASNERGRIPLLVTRTAGTGKVLFMGTDGAWRWREGYEDRYHYRFWGQVIRWMAYQRNMNVGESMRLFFAPDRPRVRSAVSLNANVMDSAGAPLAGATLEARVQSPSGRLERIAFEPASRMEGAEGERDLGAWGLYSATFRPLEPGRHRVTLSCEETGAVLDAEIPVVGDPLEQLGRPARFDTMEELARMTGGAVLEVASADVLRRRMEAVPPPPPLVTRDRVWSHPLLGAAIVALMLLFWVGRKLVGRI